ncbi:MAG: GNAT family N-acetyltransferase [Flavobacteriales bacterium]|nr:GNAT family N-acetyltransferase [Flavobacteriales bacterium]
MKKEVNLEIVSYSTLYQDAFLTLNLMWLEEMSLLEPYDLQVLENPEKMILDKGGEIYFGVIGEEVIATFALTPSGDRIVELNKMAVRKDYQSMGIGQQLMHFLIQLCKSKGMRQVELYSHSSLQCALHVYKKFGFQEMRLPGDCVYDLANIRMSLAL